MPILNYINEINKKFKTTEAEEHSYRGALERLIESLVDGVTVINEPKHIRHVGAPDYIIKRKDIGIGNIEAKDLDKNLDSKEYDEQFNRYRNALPNLIITNYLEFRFYRDGEKVTTVRIGHIENGKVVANTERFQEFNDLIVNFCAYRGQTIHSASKLAKMMAGKARLLADVIKNALKSDDESYDNNTLQEQMKAFKQILINDIKEEDFADVYAQTIAYGMFAGRLNDTSLNNFSRQEACECIPKSNPFLRNLFSYIAGPMLDDRIKWIVDDLADIFLATNLQEIMKDFGKATKTQDPIIHFYETFLSEYNPKLRELRGVWYTPQPVVNFIVHAVDDILKSEFGLSEGLADTSTIKFKYKNEDKDKYKIEEKEVDKVQILDPATGTGTFLAEIIRQIHEKFITMQGMWSSYVEKHLIPRLHGFEILMASYAMAHLKLDLMLKNTGYQSTSNERLKVYLTNSLEEPHPDTGTLFAGWLSREAREANEVKRDCPVMVVLGNPPYKGESSNKGKWITNLIDVYKQEPTGGRLQEKNPKWINNDYVKFIRYAEHFIEKNNNGIVSYITSNSFLEGKTFRGMRYHLLQTFDKIYILNLHGYKNGEIIECTPDGSTDENVFDIKQGVSISLFIKTNKKRKGQLAEVYYYDLYGKRENKYEFLTEHSLNNIDFGKLEYQAPYYFFIKKDFGLSKKYDKGFGIKELFRVNNVGIVTSRDNLTTGNTENEVMCRVQDFAYLDPEIARQKYNLGKDVRDWRIVWAQRDLVASQVSQEKIVQMNYRPFDIKYTYYTGNSRGFYCYPRHETMKHFIKRKNLGLILNSFIKNNDINHFFITDKITDLHILETANASANIFPLYLYNDLNNTRQPNFSSEIIKKFADGLKLRFVTEKSSKEETFAPIDVLDYIYAVLHSPKYRETYKEFLKIDFPKVPYPTDKAKFWKLVDLGSQIRKIHLLESDKLSTLSIGYPVSGDNIITKLSYSEGKVYINDTQYFDSVPEVAWNFYIGGYQPAQKWLKDRKGKELSFDDIKHYAKIINALYLTNQLMKQIDEVDLV